MSKNIVLIGFMGTGKSSVGAALAGSLSLDFLDTDTMIESKENMSISDIFSTKGEPFFRECETLVLNELIGNKKSPFVLSTGGGLPIQNQDTLKRLGTIVYLNTSLETIKNRVSNDTSRPLLKNIDALYNERQSLYSNLADLCIDTDNYDINEIVDKIIESL